MLTVAQTARLYDLSAAHAKALLDALEGDGFLIGGSSGAPLAAVTADPSTSERRVPDFRQRPEAASAPAGFGRQTLTFPEKIDRWQRGCSRHQRREGFMFRVMAGVVCVGLRRQPPRT